MRAYAFLCNGARVYLTGLQWPAPGRWIERDDDAIRACNIADLPWWLDDELWVVELAGDVRELGRALTAHSGRLLRRIDVWNDDAAGDFLLACARRARDHAADALAAAGRSSEAARLAAADDLESIESVGGELATQDDLASTLAGLAADVVLYARDAGTSSRAAGVAAYVAAFAAAGADKRGRDYEQRFAIERGWQAAWLRERLAL